MARSEPRSFPYITLNLVGAENHIGEFSLLIGHGQFWSGRSRRYYDFRRGTFGVLERVSVNLGNASSQVPQTCSFPHSPPDPAQHFLFAAHKEAERMQISTVSSKPSRLVSAFIRNPRGRLCWQPARNEPNRFCRNKASPAVTKDRATAILCKDIKDRDLSLPNLSVSA